MPKKCNASTHILVLLSKSTIFMHFNMIIYNKMPFFNTALLWYIFWNLYFSLFLQPRNLRLPHFLNCGKHCVESTIYFQRLTTCACFSTFIFKKLLKSERAYHLQLYYIIIMLILPGCPKSFSINML